MKRWPTKPLGKLITIEKGKKAPDSFAVPTRTSLRYLQIEDLRPDTTLKYCEPFNCPRATNSDVIIAWDGANAGTVSCNLAGHIGSTLAVLCPIDANALSPVFLSRLLEGNFDYLQRTATGATIPHVSKDALNSLEIPLPPLAEQERIVKLLDEADELRKLRAQADRRTAALLPALFHEMFGDPARNEKSWSVQPFGDLASNQDGRRKPVKASDRAERKGEYPYYGASGIIDYVEEYLFDETALLIGEDGANLLARSTPIAFLAHGKYWVNNHAHVVTDNGNADLVYLCAALNLRDLADYVTGSAQPKLNQANMNRIPIPVPPLSLQKEFAQRVAEIRELEAAQAASRQRLKALFQSLLHRAFNGEL